MALISAPCAVCDGSRFALVYRGTIPDAGADPRSYFSSSRARVGHHPVVRCLECGLRMANPRDDDRTIAEAYADLRDDTYDLDEAPRRRTAQRLLGLMERHQSRAGRVLDIGCATGIFLEVARQAGWQATGVEASAWAVAQAERRTPGARVLHGRVEDVNLAPASFDAVVLWDVLEHVRSPCEALARARTWLDPAGRLYLKVPDSGSLVARAMGRHWVLLLREHLWYFDAETVARLLRRTGFDLVARRAGRIRVSARNVLARLGQYDGRRARVARRLATWPGLAAVQVPLWIGEMEVVARPTAGGDGGP